MVHKSGAALPRRAFRRFGRRYPRLVLAVQFQVTGLVGLGGVGLLALYQDMTTGEFLRVLAVTEVLILVENVFATRLAARMLGPVNRWLEGSRDERSTVEAWRALAELPAEFLRRFKFVPLAGSVPAVSIYAAIELDLPAYSVLILLAGAFGVLLYGATLRFFAMELAMHPVLVEVSKELPEDFDLGRAGVPLRLKLLAALPMINVFTGVLVAGLSREGPARITDLGVDVLVAVAVASTVSLELIVLLSRSVLAPIHSLREATQRIARGDLAARVPVISTDETGSLAQSFNEMAAGLEERERLREAFGTFVDPDVAERVMREGTLLGDDVEVSVLFLDIRDFTAFAERSSAREVVARLNDFYERVVPVLHRHGGHANRFIGDGLLGVFGAPERVPDHADRAVAAALEIAELVREHYGDDLRIGIGVNSGPVLAGTIGGGGRLDFTVIGDPVNTAARVEAVTRETGDDVLITEAARCLLTREHVELVERPAGELKGKTELVRVWAPAPAAGASAEAREAVPAARETT